MVLDGQEMDTTLFKMVKATCTKARRRRKRRRNNDEDSERNLRLALLK